MCTTPWPVWSTLKYVFRRFTVTLEKRTQNTVVQLKKIVTENARRCEPLTHPIRGTNELSDQFGLGKVTHLTRRQSYFDFWYEIDVNATLRHSFVSNRLNSNEKLYHSELTFRQVFWLINFSFLFDGLFSRVSRFVFLDTKMVTRWRFEYQSSHCDWLRWSSNRVQVL